jgi:UDP-arabinose 4-epimerase
VNASCTPWRLSSSRCAVMIGSVHARLGEQQKNILVTGGAGYIGSHTCKYLARSGFLPITYDDLSTGAANAVRWGPLIVADIADVAVLSRVIEEYGISAVIHFAASAYVGESVVNPRKYFHNNLVKTLSLMNCLLDHGIQEIVFSSTCAVYGVPQQLPINESHPQNPINPYGESKLAIEKVLRWYGDAYDMRWISLRYFNAAGADPDGEIGESHPEETHLIPLAIQAAFPGKQPLRIFGADYPTSDGTAVRDYVHVTDLAKAHLLALHRLRADGGKRAFNLGTGNGHSVREVIGAVERVAKRAPATVQFERRKGDPAVLVADASVARRDLCWTPEHSHLDEIVRTAWLWFERQGRTNTKTEVSKAALAV